MESALRILTFSHFPIQGKAIPRFHQPLYIALQSHLVTFLFNVPSGFLNYYTPSISILADSQLIPYTVTWADLGKSLPHLLKPVSNGVLLPPSHTEGDNFET
jgi:hypothetical protein